MDPRSKLALAVLLMALSLFAIAGVLGYKYVKVAHYACYYGSADPNSWEDLDWKSPTGQAMPASSFVNGTWVNHNDLHCVPVPEDGFVCPAEFAGGTHLNGYQFVTVRSISGFL